MSWERDYDRWKTTPPVDSDPQVVDSCELCGGDTVEGQEIYVCDNSRAKLCSSDCAKEWLMGEWQEYFTCTEEEYRDPRQEYENCLAGDMFTGDY